MEGEANPLPLRQCGGSGSLEEGLLPEQSCNEHNKSDIG